MVISKEWENTIYSNATEELTLTTLHTFHQPRTPFYQIKIKILRCIYIETSQKGEEVQASSFSNPSQVWTTLKSCYFLSTKFNFNSKNTFISFFKILWFACFAPIWSVQDKYFAFNLADAPWDTLETYQLVLSHRWKGRRQNVKYVLCVSPWHGCQICQMYQICRIRKICEICQQNIWNM